MTYVSAVLGTRSISRLISEAHFRRKQLQVNEPRADLIASGSRPIDPITGQTEAHVEPLPEPSSELETYIEPFTIATKPDKRMLDAAVEAYNISMAELHSHRWAVVQIFKALRHAALIASGSAGVQDCLETGEPHYIFTVLLSPHKLLLDPFRTGFASDADRSHDNRGRAYAAALQAETLSSQACGEVHL